MGIVLFSACDDDRDSNPVLNTSGSATFHLNAPEIGNATVDLASSQGIDLTWNQPVLTNNNAPLGSSGVYGFQYLVQISKDGNFTKSFAEALAEATDAEGNIGEVKGHDYTTIQTQFSGTVNTVSATDINRALNELYLWPNEDALPKVGVDAYIRVTAQYNGADGYKLLATSNAQKVSAIPASWIDVTAAPVEISYLWMPGNGNGWNHADCPKLICEDGVTYKGYAYMDGEFKFTLVPEWKDELNNGSFTSTTKNIDLGDGAGGNINYTGDPCMCWVEVTPSTGELLVTPVHWGIVGGFNSWKVTEGDIIEMTYDKDAHALKAVIDGGLTGEWKFARDYSWDVNFGGALDALEQDGANLTAEGTTIYLYIEKADEKPHASVE